ncbi:MAG: hypothetical protein NTZ74_00995 [Chloroflexi bacterium]|nr:hypothetical protein [Chloroflexota bacterium]
MAEILCPICQRVNDSGVERCWYCQAILLPEKSEEKSRNTDWLNEFRGDSEQKSDEDQPIAPAENDGVSEAAEQVPDWLARIRIREQQERENDKNHQEEVVKPPPEEEFPDWLKAIQSGNAAENWGSENEEAAAQPFLESIPEESGQENAPSLVGEEPLEDTQDWLSHLAEWRGEEPVHREAGQDLEMNELKAEEPMAETAAGTPPGSGLHGADSGEVEFQQGNEDILPREDEAPALETGSLPGDWTESLPDPETENSPGVDIKVTFREESLEKTEEREPPKPLEGVEELLPPEGEVRVDFLQKKILAEEVVPPTDGKEILGEKGSPEAITESLSVEDGDEILDLQSPSEMDEPLSSHLETKGKEEDWVSGFQKLEEDKDLSSQAIPPSGDESAESVPFFLNDLPEWLSSAVIEKPIRKETQAELDPNFTDQIGGDLEKAQLPAWLQAMRPVGSAVTNTSAESIPDHVDQDGLLAGIEGTLQSTDLPGNFRKPVSYGMGLKVSDRQKANANLFARLLDESSDDEAVETPANPQRTHLALRFGFAFLLIAIIVITNLNFQSLNILPLLYPAEVVRTFDVVNGIQIDKPVLLAGDFDAALSGELMWGSETLIEHLMRRNIKIVMVSTNPVGAAVLNGQLAKDILNVPAYSFENNVINLGYLAGGSTALQSLTTSLHSTLLFTQDLKPTWENAIMQKVNSLKDLGAVIVITDKAENARSWIEQVQPALGATPLLIVISAQAAPLIQPYYQSGQVAGFLAGLNGSLAYELILQQPGSATHHLSSYQLSILFLVMALLIGGLVSLIQPAPPPQKGK